MDLAYLHEFCRKFDYPAAAETALTAGAQAIAADPEAGRVFDALVAEYERLGTDTDLNAALRELRRHDGHLAVPAETAELLLFIAYSAHLHTLYMARGVSEAIYFDSMCDLKWKLTECYECRGIWGSFVADWFPRLFQMTRFALGRLQYELIQMPQITSEDGKYAFDGDKAVNVHIPSAGPLRQDTLDESFRRAALFFAPEFPDGTVRFVCHSWLLTPMHAQMLPETSGIRLFMRYFDIFGFKEDPKDSDLWRVFRTADLHDPDALPADTGLQRAYIRLLRSGGHSGAAWGVRMMRVPEQGE